MPYSSFLKKQQNLKLSSAEIVGGALRVKLSALSCMSPASLFWKPVLNNNEKKCSRLNLS